MYKFLWNCKGYLWNSTQNILPIHWKIWLLCNVENLRALKFKSSQIYELVCILKHLPGLSIISDIKVHFIVTDKTHISLSAVFCKVFIIKIVITLKCIIWNITLKNITKSHYEHIHYTMILYRVQHIQLWTYKMQPTFHFQKWSLRCLLWELW